MSTKPTTSRMIPAVHRIGIPNTRPNNMSTTPSVIMSSLFPSRHPRQQSSLSPLAYDPVVVAVFSETFVIQVRWSVERRDYRLCRGPRLRAQHWERGHSRLWEEWYTMSGKTDQVKGQVKEAAGALTGDKDLESEGKADRRAGEAKEKVEHAKDKIKEVVDDVEAKVEDVVDKAKDALHRK
jgi:uncharacterized protein YjbJ (UPF0337 family)